MNKILCPSMMCADFSILKEEVIQLDQAGIDIFHCDIMDGTYAPNITMGLMDVEAIRKYTKKPIDVHLMIENPSEKVEWFAKAGANIIYIHPETDRYPSKTLLRIKELGCSAGIVINPHETIETHKELLPLVDYVMIMTVHPGFSGQKFLEFTHDKIVQAASIKDVYSYSLIIDGNCNPEKVERYSKLGVDGFVLGTSALFNQNKSYTDLVEALRHD